MSNDFSKHLFIVVKHPRLDFETASPKVEQFIGRRLEHFKAGSFLFVSDRDEAAAKVSSICTNAQLAFDFIVEQDIMNPFCDLDVVEKMTAMLERTGAASCSCEGAVPGTQVNRVISVKGSLNPGNTIICRHNSQHVYNNQLNIYKYKRLKLFLALIGKVENIHTMSIDEIMQTLASDKVFELLAGFGEDVKLGTHKSCPHCSGHLHPLYNTMSQPFCGYIPSNRSLYGECENCGLVIATPFVDANDISKVYDKWDKQDFVVTTNNPYTDDSIRCDLKKILPFLPEATSSLDLGGGMGNFSKYLAGKYSTWNVTHSDFAIKAAVEGNIQSRALDFTNEPIGEETYDLITAWEVVEHIPFEKFAFVFDNIWKALKPGGFFMFSTPDYDSPVCKSFDFYALCPPFHYTVLGKKWLLNYFADSKRFDVFDTKHCSDFLDDALNWYGYGEQTATSMSVRNTSTLLKSIFSFDEDLSLRKKLTAAGMGTEIIVTLRKK